MDLWPWSVSGHRGLLGALSVLHISTSDDGLSKRCEKNRCHEHVGELVACFRRGQVDVSARDGLYGLGVASKPPIGKRTRFTLRSLQDNIADSLRRFK